MSKSPPCAVLIVLSGPRQGASVPLGPTPCLIGADDGCDLLIADGDAPHERAWIAATDEGGRLCRTSFDSGSSPAPSGDAWEAVPLAMPFVIAGVRLAIFTSLNDPRTRAEDAAFDGDAAKADERLAEAALSRRGPKSPARRLTRRAVAVVSALLVAGGVALTGARTFAGPNPHADRPLLAANDEKLAAAAAEAALAKAELALASAGLDRVLSPRAESGGIRLIGYTDSPMEADGIHARLDAAGMQYETRLQATEELASEVRRYLHQNGLRVDVSSVGHGRLKLGGLVDSADELGQRLRKRFPDAAGFEHAVISAADARHLARDRAKRLGIQLVEPATTKHAPSADDRLTIVVGGSAVQANRLAAALAGDAIRQGVVIEARVVAQTEAKSRVSAATPKMIVMGPVPYKVLRDGSKVFAASSMPG